MIWRAEGRLTENLLALVPKAAQQAVAAFVRTIFAQPDHSSAMAQLDRVAEGLRPRFPQAAELLTEAAEDLLAHFHFPAERRRRLHSTNTLERLHKEVKRRTNVVGIFPDRRSLLRLVGMLLVEQDDEWAVADRRYLSLESMRRLYEAEGGEVPGETRGSDRVSEDGGVKFHQLAGRGPRSTRALESLAFVGFTRGRLAFPSDRNEAWGSGASPAIRGRRDSPPRRCDAPPKRRSWSLPCRRGPPASA